MNWCRLLVLAAVLLDAPIGHGAEAQALPTLTTVKQVRELSQDEAARGHPIRLRGVLTFHDWKTQPSHSRLRKSVGAGRVFRQKAG